MRVRPVERRERPEERDGRKAVGEGHRENAESENRQGLPEAYRDDRDSPQGTALKCRRRPPSRETRRDRAISCRPSGGRRRAGRSRSRATTSRRMSGACFCSRSTRLFARYSRKGTSWIAAASVPRTPPRARKAPDRAIFSIGALPQRERPDEEGGEEVEERRLRMTAEVHREERERQAAGGPGAGRSRQPDGPQEEERQEHVDVRVRPREPRHERKRVRERDAAERRCGAGAAEGAQPEKGGRSRDHEAARQDERPGPGPEQGEERQREKGRGLGVRGERQAEARIRVPQRPVAARISSPHLTNHG